MATTVSLHGDEWDVERVVGGAEERLLHVGRRVGGELLGGTMFEVGPGYRGPYHLHHGNEELVLVVGGTLTLRTEEGEQELRPGDVSVFRRGRAGLHALENRSAGPVRFVVFSSMVDPDVSELPESGTIGVFAGGVPTAGADTELEAFFPRESAQGYEQALY